MAAHRDSPTVYFYDEDHAALLALAGGSSKDGILSARHKGQFRSSSSAKKADLCSALGDSQGAPSSAWYRPRGSGRYGLSATFSKFVSQDAAYNKRCIGVVGGHLGFVPIGIWEVSSTDEPTAGLHQQAQKSPLPTLCVVLCGLPAKLEAYKYVGGCARQRCRLQRLSTRNPYNQVIRLDLASLKELERSDSRPQRHAVCEDVQAHVEWYKTDADFSQFLQKLTARKPPSHVEWLRSTGEVRLKYPEGQVLFGRSFRRDIQVRPAWIGQTDWKNSMKLLLQELSNGSNSGSGPPSSAGARSSSLMSSSSSGPRSLDRQTPPFFVTFEIVVVTQQRLGSGFNVAGLYGFPGFESPQRHLPARRDVQKRNVWKAETDLPRASLDPRRSYDIHTLGTTMSGQPLVLTFTYKFKDASDPRRPGVIVTLRIMNEAAH